MSAAAGDSGEGDAPRKITLKVKPPTAPAPGEEDDVPDSDDAQSDSDYEEEKDWTDLEAKMDHAHRPLYVGKDRHVIVEKFSPFFRFAEDFMIAIAEPVSRCRPPLCSLHTFINPRVTLAAMQAKREAG
jgi:hypothetical protein